MPAMGTKSREVIRGGQITGAKIRARALTQPSPTIGQYINGGLGWLEVECNRCKTRASLPLDETRCLDVMAFAAQAANPQPRS
jgi:hypothetical protein